MSAPVPDPDAEELTSAGRVQRMLSRPADSTEDLESVIEAVEAVKAIVPTWLDRPAGGWRPHQHYGATLLAARLYRRKDSPGGFASFGIEGGAYVQSNWADVAMLLGLSSYAVGRPG